MTVRRSVRQDSRSDREVELRSLHHAFCSAGAVRPKDHWINRQGLASSIPARAATQCMIGNIAVWTNKA